MKQSGVPPRSSLAAMIVAVALTLLSLFLHFQNFQHAGALWRDEVMGGIVVMLRRRDRQGIVAVLSIGAISALSLVLYLPMIQGNRAWSDLVRYNVGPSWFWTRWGDALEMNGESMRLLWTLLLADVEVRLAEGGRVWIVAPPADTQTAISSQPRPRLVADDQIWRTGLDTLLGSRRPRQQLFRLGSVRGAFENLLLELSIVDTASPSPL